MQDPTKDRGGGAEALVRGYFRDFFSGPADHTEVRPLLTDDFVFRGPMLEADSADDYVAHLAAYGGEMDLRVSVRRLMAQGDTVAALVDLEAPVRATYAQWFTVRDDRIARLEVVYDTRVFLAESPAEEPTD